MNDEWKAIAFPFIIHPAKFIIVFQTATGALMCGCDW